MKPTRNPFKDPFITFLLGFTIATVIFTYWYFSSLLSLLTKAAAGAI